MPRRARHPTLAAALAAAAACLAPACASSPPAEISYVTVFVDCVESPQRDVALRVALERLTESGERLPVGQATQRLVAQARPIEVQVQFDPNDIDPTARYEVRAWFDQTQTLIVYSGSEPVLTQGNPSTALLRFDRRPDRWPSAAIR
jgi:hypothetical protein